ncbi:MAG: hypothetical protein EOP23_13950 [Hyphomicrobiales bacterium]|nr:MAG: hypothetical protein EOP23_13950 [Hyphomicrobiales bacterium]
MNDGLSSETEAVWRLHCPINAAKARRFRRLRRPITQLCTGPDAAASDDIGDGSWKRSGKTPHPEPNSLGVSLPIGRNASWTLPALASKHAVAIREYRTFGSRATSDTRRPEAQSII